MTRETRQVIAYFCLVIVLTAPLWLIGQLAPLNLLPGLPIAATAVLCPALAAIFLAYRSQGWTGLRALVFQTLDARKAGWWLVPAALLNPILFTLAFVVARLSGLPIPEPKASIPQALLLFALFLPTAISEELGWTGFALERLQARHGWLQSSLILGLFWAVWHYPPLLQVGRSVEWIVWWSLWTVSARVIMVLLYRWSGRSLFAVALYHAMSNLCWQLYPVSGSWFDPRLSGLITFALAVILMLAELARSQATAADR